MNASKVGSLAALAGGVFWSANVALIWGNDGAHTSGGPISVAFFLGLAALLVALLAAGYSLVSTAPIWLRAVVSVAVALLGWVLFIVVDDAAKGLYSSTGWLRDELAVLITAVLAVALGVAGLVRSRQPASKQPPAHGHRAAH